jgi:hypothetical protein
MSSTLSLTAAMLRIKSQAGKEQALDVDEFESINRA